MIYKIRKANIEDSKDLNYLLTLLIRDEKKYDQSINENCIINKFYEDMLNNESNISFVAVIDNKIVGYLYGYIVNNGDAYLDKVSKLDALYVLEEYRNLKIASNLINEFKKWSINNQVKYIEVQVLNENKSAYNLYNKENFNSFKTTLITKL